MKFPKKHIACAWLLLSLLSGYQPALSQELESATLSLAKPIDVCGDKIDREVQLLVNIGLIKKSDSLFGFDLEIKFDRNKIKFNSALLIGTLADNFDTKVNPTFSVDLQGNGVISAAGMNFNYNLPPVYGNKPLIAFLGEYLGNCPETLEIKLTDIQFTDEFKKTFSRNSVNTIKAEIYDNPQRYLRFILPTNKIIFDTFEIKTSISLKINKVQGLDSLEFLIAFDNPTNYFVSDIKSKNNNVIIDSVLDDAKGKRLKTRILQPVNNEDIFEVEFTRKIDKDENIKIHFTPLKVNGCACATRLLDTTILLLNTKNPVTSINNDEIINNNYIGYVSSDNKYFIVETSNSLPQNLILYNMQGNEINTEITINNKSIIVNLDNISNGLYLAVIRNKKNEIRIIKFIKNQ
ncbi:MAG: hypothetical protein HW421_39 [Ignavibacteria bacterium]|nr:hypothetical protein [Ignavibacteria bacterium]